MNTNRRILIIDDNESIHQDFHKILNPTIPGKAALTSAAAEIFGEASAARGTGDYEVDSAFQGQEGLKKVREACAAGRPYAMAFVDLRMPPGWDGVETIRRIWSEYPELEVVVCTAYSDYTLDQIVSQLGRTDRLLILKKPFDSIEVLQFAGALTEKWCLRREARSKMEELEARVEERTREIREGQQQLVEARKMELVGRVAGGIAHDFNTLLTSIIGHAELIRQEAVARSQTSVCAAEIDKAAGAAAALTHQLLAFSSRQMLKPERMDANAATAAMETPLRQLLGPDIKVSIASRADDPWIYTDASQFCEVLISLAHNSRDAMPDGGQFTIETSDAVFKRAEPGIAPGRYVRITVADTGAGIPAEARSHIFEPFFTTKNLGEGKGLGLAMCQGILKQSGGRITLRPGTTSGATFDIYLPCHEEEREVARDAPATEAPPAVGIILLVEEDDTLRSISATVLGQAGYTVHAAGTVNEAITMAGSLDHVDLLLADARLPEMTGPELARWITPLHPAMTKVYCVASDKEEIAPDGAGSIRKPYAPASLIARVREALVN